MASEVLKIDLKASDSTGAAFAALQRNISNTSKMFSTFQGVVKGSLGLLAAGSLGEAIGAVRQYADAWTMMQNRLKSAGLASGETAVAQAKIVDIATKSRSSLAEVGNLYARIAFATEELGTSQADVAKITETLSKAFKLSGKTALESQSAVTQLTQALASGVLQGDELRSLRENAPEVARAIAEAFGVTVGELKKLGAEGKLTADKIIPAILGASDKIEQRFAQTRSTFEDYGIAISNFFQRSVASIQDFVFASNEAVSATKKVLEQEELLRKSGRGARPIAVIEDPAIQVMRDRNKMYDEEVKKVEESYEKLLNLAKNFNANQTVLTQRGQIQEQKITPAQIVLIRQAFAEFSKTQKASEDFTKLNLSIEEAASGSVNFKAIEGLTSLIRSLAVATEQVRALKVELQGTSAMGMSMGGKTPIVPEYSLPPNFASGSMKAFDDATASAAYNTYLLDNRLKMFTGTEKAFDAQNVATYTGLNQFAEKASGAGANIKKMAEDLAPVDDQMKELQQAFEGFGRKSADAIAEFVVSGKMDFRDLIQTMIKEMISMMVYQNLLKGMFTGGGGGFNFLSLLGFGGGIGSRTTIAGGATGGLRANGGPVSANRPYIVGEKGPELFMSGSSGSIVPNNALGGNSGGGVTINQTINVSTGVQQTVRAEIQQLLPQISNAAKNAVVDAKRRGGSFAMAFGG